MLEVQLRVPLKDFALEAAVRCAGPVTALVGASGAGKTSLLEAIAGLRRGVRGRIVADGETLLDSDAQLHVPPEHRRIGYVPQDTLLFPHLKVEQHLRFAPAARRADLREVVELLELGPLLGRMPATLSGGEKQRVALGRALASKPRLLLLDEPLAAVDVQRRARVLPYLLRVKRELRLPMLYVTHQWSEARVLADEAVVLARGHIVAQGHPAEVLERPEALTLAGAYDNVLRGRVVELTGDSAVLDLEGLRLTVPGAEDLRVGDDASFLLPAEDVLLALEPLHSVSARNVLPAQVREVREEAHAAMVRLELNARVPLWARVTHASVGALGLTAARRVFVAVKTQALRRL